MARNPPWTREELILALDLYFRLNRKLPSRNHPDVIQLSQRINKLPVHKNKVRSNSFRNPAGIVMKLANFSRFDPKYPGAGLSRGSKLESEIWGYFSQSPARLRQVAKAILEGANEADSLTEVEPDEEFVEGNVLSRLHRARERDRRAVQRKKELILKETGQLACEICGFDFEAHYGDIGRGFAECHHKLPLAKLPGNRKTTLSDLAIVCANCHRMLHRNGSAISINQLRELMEERKSQLLLQK